ncbi:hypothetical protein Syun_018552 [Stephania yunnanensis]|uniref:Plastocyanin-like domain-containing protein n=1 Tax=Stephania yunnanensis TaxID=152371 RepID=A0AAP0IT45_9MAGN
MKKNNEGLGENDEDDDQWTNLTASGPRPNPQGSLWSDQHYPDYHSCQFCWPSEWQAKPASDGYAFFVVGMDGGQWTPASRKGNLNDAVSRCTTQVYQSHGLLFTYHWKCGNVELENGILGAPVSRPTILSSLSGGINSTLYREMPLLAERQQEAHTSPIIHDSCYVQV